MKHLKTCWKHFHYRDNGYDFIRMEPREKLGNLCVFDKNFLFYEKAATVWPLVDNYVSFSNEYQNILFPVMKIFNIFICCWFQVHGYAFDSAGLLAAILENSQNQVGQIFASSYLFSCDQAAIWLVQSVRLSVRLSHLFHHVPIIVSSWNFQELLPWSKVMSMQKVKVRGQRSRSQRSTPNLAVSGL